jgi:hypothetical protein
VIHEHRRRHLSSLVAHLLKKVAGAIFVNFHRSRAAIAGGFALSCVASSLKSG